MDAWLESTLCPKSLWRWLFQSLVATVQEVAVVVESTAQLLLSGDLDVFGTVKLLLCIRYWSRSVAHDGRDLVALC